MKNYHVIRMPNKDGFGLISTSQKIKQKPLFTGTFEEAFAKKKLFMSNPAEARLIEASWEKQEEKKTKSLIKKFR